MNILGEEKGSTLRVCPLFLFFLLKSIFIYLLLIWHIASFKFKVYSGTLIICPLDLFLKL